MYEATCLLLESLTEDRIHVLVCERQGDHTIAERQEIADHIDELHNLLDRARHELKGGE